MSDKMPKVVWLYEKNHMKQPFIRVALESLANHGSSTTIVSMSFPIKEELVYEHVPLLNRLNRRFLKREYGAEKMAMFMPAIMFCHTLLKRPDVVIATLPIGLLAGWLAKKLLKARLVYYPLELYGEQASLFSPFLERMEARVLKRGIDALITQNEERAKVYVQERGARVVPTIVHNYKRHRKVTGANKLRKLLRLPEETQIVLYEGLLRPGRWLENLVQSAAYLPQNAMLVLMGNKGKEYVWWEQNIESLLRQSHIGSKVRLAPWIKQEELLSYVADADAGAIIYDDKFRNNYYCEPGKLSDYVLAGVPVVVPGFPTIGPVVDYYKIGAVFNGPEPKEIARAITSVLALPRERWQSVLDRARKDLVWETQLPDFLKAVAGT